ncbi:hypothetical protein TNCV_3523881 [Trichonephila clavipes]|uniref:Uncharacterized protein n=1 Tax=Trichonephila clavipes TaxID=2585209 RepID=A0A8X6V6D3_TRICX|nr:hypothetical protein TNCV_3523881 [Trichonephila clavipes]
MASNWKNRKRLKEAGVTRHLDGTHNPKVLWIDKGVPSLLENETLGVSRQTDQLIGTSAHTPPGPRSRLLKWAHYTLALMGC